ncbi:MAG: SCP2 sterol-binding domain-containing protein, partial [Dongiaceae bacterium]
AKGRGRDCFLTPAGEELRPLIVHLGRWGQRWSRKPFRAYDLDVTVLMWDIHRRIRVSQLPPRRTVVRFEFRGMPKGSTATRTWWLVLQRADVDLCMKDPGFEVDLYVDADLGALTAVWLGDLQLAEATRSGQLIIDGPRALAQSFPNWLALSSFANVERPAPAATAR